MDIRLYYNKGYTAWYGSWVLDIWTPLTAVEGEVCLTRCTVEDETDIASLYLLVKSQLKKHKIQYARDNRNIMDTTKDLL